MGQKTTIQIEHDTLLRLQNLRIAKRETYDEIINRLMTKESCNKLRR